MSAMKPRYRISREAIELIKRFEGYRPKSAQLPDGSWTIGHGHTLTAREGAVVSEQDAEALLLYDLIAVAHAVNENTYLPLTQNQFDALVAFAFNIGVENFRRSSVLRRLNEGQVLQAACAMELWRKSVFEGERIVVDALVRRRSAEKALFLTPLGGFVPAPTPILPPSVDMDSLGQVPREVPTALTVAMDGDQAVAERDETPAVQAFAPDAEEGPSPTEAAAAAVTSRLSTIFAEPREEPATAADDGFALTAPEEDFSREALDETREDAPVEEAADVGQTEPGLFDLPVIAANDQSDQTVHADQAEQTETAPVELLLADTAPAETTSVDVAPVVAEAATEQDTITLPIETGAAPARGRFTAPLILGAAGVGIFASGVYSGVNNQNTLAWLAGVLGIGLFAVAVYLLLDRLGEVDADFEPEDETDPRDE